ncbi:MAG TPA: 23S ribosomal RNA methyltransferase Erm [Candidatus Brachybacterium merdigallinarum]|nr:23S ribosomal RNA methyltransferase Erm [Candidatus Brachybacterium merdigallinarum]
MPTYGGGRHEHGQNFLTDHRLIARIIDLVARTDGPIVEIGPGHGALTRDLQELHRPLTAVEIDAKNVRRLERRLRPEVELIHGDFLRWRMPEEPHVVVGNLPFHQTTAMLRRVLHAPGWTHAVLLVQWEVARRRAGVGGATMMTAQWWPWVDFSLEGRVPSTAFTPAPTVDGGILTMRRRRDALVPVREQKRYREFVHAVFSGRGHGLVAVLTHLVPPRRRQEVKARLAREAISPTALPKDLVAEQWAMLYAAMTEWGWAPGGRGGDASQDGAPRGGASRGGSGGKARAARDGRRERTQEPRRAGAGRRGARGGSRG